MAYCAALFVKMQYIPHTATKLQDQWWTTEGWCYEHWVTEPSSYQLVLHSYIKKKKSHVLKKLF